MRGARRNLPAVALSALLLSGATARIATAQPSDAIEPVQGGAPGGDVPTAYLRAAQLAHREYELRNYPEARARFLEAHRIYPNARSLRALGAVEYDLKSYVQSIEHLERALASTVRPLEGELRAETEELLRLARGYVAIYTIAVEPAGVGIELDEEQVTLRADGKLLVEVGDHVLMAHAPGYLSLRKTVRATGGAHETLRIALMPMPQEPTEKAEPLRKKWWVWTMAGVLAAGTAAGLAVAFSGREHTAAPSDSNLPGVPSVHASR